MRVLIDGLPPESLTLTRIRDSLTPEQRAELAGRESAGHGQWSRTEMLLALLGDLVQENTWVLTAANSRKAPRRPKPIPRPGVEDKKPGLSPEALAMARELRAQMPVRELPKPEN